jgi:hypothetical protein
MKKTMQ